MICDRCGAKYTKKAAALHLCPKRRRPPTYKRGREGRMTIEEEQLLSKWTQLDLFEEFARRGLAAQAAVDAITKKRARS